jgi:hypothetical protein
MRSAIRSTTYATTTAVTGPSGRMAVGRASSSSTRGRTTRSRRRGRRVTRAGRQPGSATPSSCPRTGGGGSPSSTSTSSSVVSVSWTTSR